MWLQVGNIVALLLSTLINTNKEAFKFYVPHTNTKRQRVAQSFKYNIHTDTLLDENRYYMLEGIYLVMERVGTHK